MKIYTIFYETKKGEYERISPMGLNRDIDEMLKIAHRLKNDDNIKLVKLCVDEYKYISSDYISLD